ncbi:hypothetical protein [Tahibacter harae]|uniref:Lysylphosphatidylglycerol synthase-like protein n=1 Tax=Tahibacter harae TaxID=2963937 RepID=A0ABT1QQ43_9GAMM|nr:hypothetical protein [Tahibacter harae]MCQ4164414.1 hypothetical protein [Tahibacter harae]
MPAPAARRLLHWLRAAATPLALLFLAAAAWSARDAVAAALRQAQLAPLLLALPLWASLHLLTPLYAHLILRRGGAPLAYADALRIHVARLPARYLPGGIWHTVTKAADFHALGVDKAQLPLLVFLENAVPFALALTLGSAALLAAGTALPVQIGLALGLALVLLPPLALRRLPALRSQRLGLGVYARLLAVSSLFWCLAAAAFAIYWQAFDTPAHPPLQLAGAYLLAWALGFAALFAPQGLGVFETAIALLLDDATPFAGLLVLAAGFRALGLAADLLSYALYALLRLRRR